MPVVVSLSAVVYHHCCILQLENRSKRPPEAPRECLTSELSGHTLPVVLGISLLIKTIQQRSVKSWIVSTKDRFQQKLLEKACFAGYRSLDKSDRYWYFTQFTGYKQARSQRPEILVSLISVSDLMSVMWSGEYSPAIRRVFFFRWKGNYSSTTGTQRTADLVLDSLESFAPHSQFFPG